MRNTMYQLAIDLAASIMFAATLHEQSGAHDKITGMVAFVISLAVLTLRPFITAHLNKRVAIR